LLALKDKGMGGLDCLRKEKEKKELLFEYIFACLSFLWAPFRRIK